VLRQLGAFARLTTWFGLASDTRAPKTAANSPYIQSIVVQISRMEAGSIQSKVERQAVLGFGRLPDFLKAK